MNRRLSLVAIGCVPPLAGSSASAQCTWVSAPSPPGGTVRALTSWDPDGTGPAPPVLVAGMASSAGVKTWNGQAWSPLAGLSGGYVLLVHHGDLLGSDQDRVARWTGAAWSDVGSSSPGLVASLATAPDGSLVAGIAPSGPAARLDGTTWSPMAWYPGTWGYALSIYEGDLVVAGFGYYGPVARWTGSTWERIGDLSNNMYSITVYRGSLVASGVGGVYRWTGADWQNIGASTAAIPALLAAGEFLYVGGTFTSFAGVAASNIVRFDGAAWSALGSGVSGGTSPVVYALSIHEGDLFVGGRFTSAGGLSATNLARLHCVSCYPNCDGSTGPSPLNVNDFVCFQNRFAAADPYADCDQSGGLNVNDFVCFQAAFAAGCP